ncbi:MAG: energy transducer TonB [Bacteroidales bacterium]|nr:energy transducer TonB [Bacteroidales bacterium]
MKTLLFSVSLTFISAMFSQINPTTDPNKYKDKQNMDVIYSREARYKGDVKEMYKIIYSNITIPEAAKKVNLRDTMLVSFDVNFDGKIQDVRIIHGVGYGIDEQVVRIIPTLPFEPAITNGIPVRQNMMISIPIVAYEEGK